MSRVDRDVRLRHMYDAAHEAVSLARGKSREDLDSDRLLNLALVRLLEIVAEAAGKVPDDQQSQLPDIHWAQFVSLRNRLIHGYDSVDFDIPWRIVTSDLHLLVEQSERILK